MTKRAEAEARSAWTKMEMAQKRFEAAEAALSRAARGWVTATMEWQWAAAAARNVGAGCASATAGLVKKPNARRT